MVKKIKNQASDEHLFRQEMGDVVPLRTPARSDSKAPRTTKRKTRLEDATENDHGFISAVDERTHIDADDGSSHRKNGVQKRIVQKLKRGQFPVGDQLDLHSMTTEAARTVLLRFINGSQSTKLECIRVIHGKGLRSKNGPRLKTMTRQVLRDHPLVLAFTECKPADGGSGAVDVLLKSS